MFLVFLCLTVLVVKVENNDKINAKLPNATEGMEIILKSWYPLDAEFNESCVSEGCPALKNFSLCYKDVNMTVLYSVLKTATDCMRNPICGFPIDMMPTPSVTTTTEEWLNGMEIDGTITILPGTCYMTNISNIEFRVISNKYQTQPLPLRITMFISNFRAFGDIRLALTLRTLFPSILGQALSVTLPQAKYDIGLEYVSIMAINHSLTGPNFKIRLLNPILKAHPVFCGLDMPEGFPSILTLFNSMSEIIIDKSSWVMRKSAFLEKYFQSIIQSITNKC